MLIHSLSPTGVLQHLLVSPRGETLSVGVCKDVLDPCRANEHLTTKGGSVEKHDYVPGCGAE